jgi:hypothetical protein
MKKPITSKSLRKLTPVELGALRDAALTPSEQDLLFSELSRRFCADENGFLRQMWGLTT